MVNRVTKENFKELVLESEKPVMLDFYATWCGPCQMVSPLVDEIAEEHPEYNVCKVDVDEQMELAQSFGIVSIPTVMAIKDGKQTDKIVGYASKEKLIEIMK